MIDKFFKKAIEANTTEGEEGFFCLLCGKAYKHKNAVEKHLTKSHHPELVNLSIELERRDLVSSIEFWEQKILSWPDKMKKAYEEAKEEFVSRCQSDPVNTLDWLSESLVKKQESYKAASEINEVIRYCCNENSNWLEALKQALKELIAEKKEGLLQSPPRHNSTSLMSNAIQLWKHEAQCEFWGGTFSSVKELLDMIEVALKDNIRLTEIS